MLPTPMDNEFYQVVLTHYVRSGRLVTIYVDGGVSFRGEVDELSETGVLLRRPGNNCFIRMSSIRAVSVDEKT